MRVLFVASEVAPLSKAGGLGDVAGALPAALRDAGHEVVTVTPRYGSIGELRPRPDLAALPVDLGTRQLEASVLEHPETGVLCVDAPELYRRGALYTDDPDEHRRFAALSIAALEVCRALGWRPDVIHANDWHTGLLPALTQGPYARDPVVGRVPTVLTIHNLGYQGRFPASVLPEVGLYGYADLLHHPKLSSDQLSFLEVGILLADIVTTVSPTYAAEIQTPTGGAGLDGLLRARTDDLVGILNGIDTTTWNPRTDPLIPYRYSEKSLWRKERDKQALLTEQGLPYRRDVPVVGVVSRLVHQKGLDIARDPLEHFLDSWDVRLVALGSGEPAQEAMFAELAERWPDKAAFTAGYDLRLSHLIEAGADVFLMPSRYEPCGLNQMYSLAYGTVPVVHRTGGLADTVVPVDVDADRGTGFVFEHHDPQGLGWALGQALTLHIDRRRWRALQTRGMAEDNSWQRRAADYDAVYRRAASEQDRG